MANKEDKSQLLPAQPQAAYLIRCWREGETWRYSVEDVASRRRRRYDNLAELLAALQEWMLGADAGAAKK